MRSEATDRWGRRLVLTVTSLIVMASLSVGAAVPTQWATASGAAAAAAGCVSTGTSRSAAAGALVCASAQRLIVKLSGSGALVTVPLLASTAVCRAALGCNATWRDLRIGDVLDIGVSPPTLGHPLTLSVDANLTTGYGKVTALTTRSLTLDVMGRSGAPRFTRTLSILPSTVVNIGKNTFKGKTQDLHLGDAVFFTASGDSPHLLTARYWAIVVFKLR